MSNHFPSRAFRLLIGIGVLAAIAAPAYGPSAWAAAPNSPAYQTIPTVTPGGGGGTPVALPTGLAPAATPVAAAPSASSIVSWVVAAVLVVALVGGLVFVAGRRK